MIANQDKLYHDMQERPYLEDKIFSREEIVAIMIDWYLSEYEHWWISGASMYILFENNVYTNTIIGCDNNDWLADISSKLKNKKRIRNYPAKHI